MYADFEAILEPIEGSTPNPEKSYTKVINQHIPSGFCVNSKFAYGKVENPLKVCRGKDCVEALCDHICNEAHRFKSFREQWRKHNRATTCHIWLKEIKWDDIGSTQRRTFRNILQ